MILYFNLKWKHKNITRSNKNTFGIFKLHFIYTKNTEKDIEQFSYAQETYIFTEAFWTLATAPLCNFKCFSFFVALPFLRFLVFPLINLIFFLYFVAWNLEKHFWVFNRIKFLPKCLIMCYLKVIMLWS